MRKAVIALLSAALVLSAGAAFAASATASSDKKAEAPKNEASAAIEQITTGSNSGSTAKVSADKTTKVSPDKTKVSPDKTKVSPDKTALSSDKTQTQQASVSSVRPYKPSPMPQGTLETHESLFVTSEWLMKNKNSVVIIDSRPESLYIGGHIPGAVNASWTYFANMNAPTGSMKYGTVFDPATMSKRIGALGVSNKSTVVAYCDAGGWGQSGWTVWIMRMSGMKNAKILLGGYSGWKKDGGQVVKTKQTNKPAAFSIPGGYKSEYIVNTEWINNNLGKPGLVLLDVRTSPEYQGKIKPFQEKRMGHLPGAVNIEMQEFLTNDHHFKSSDEIRAILTKAGITPDSEIVVYDTAGVRAAFITMMLRYVGYPMSQCYDEGYQAWAGSPELPIQTAE